MTQADLWDKFFGKIFTDNEETKKYILELNSTYQALIKEYGNYKNEVRQERSEHLIRIEDLKILLRKAHDLMDDWNARSTAQSGGCWWCNELGYDGNGLKHKEDCILVLIRKELS